jgi:hypothetical protein
LAHEASLERDELDIEAKLLTQLPVCGGLRIIGRAHMTRASDVPGERHQGLVATAQLPQELAATVNQDRDLAVKQAWVALGVTFAHGPDNAITPVDEVEQLVRLAGAG